jgi:hypothetical protein
MEFSVNFEVIFISLVDQDYYNNYIYPREDEAGNEEEKRSFREPKRTSHPDSPVKTLIAVLRTTAENVKQIGRYRNKTFKSKISLYICLFMVHFFVP